MSRKIMIALIAVFVLTLAASTAVFGGRMKFKDVTVTTEEESGGKGGGPKNSLSQIPLIESRDKGTVTISEVKTLFARGILTGLGNLDVEVELTATGVTHGDITCTNHGEQFVEAQPRKITVVNVKFIPSEDFEKNGTTSFNVPTGDLQPLLFPGRFCPNDNWSVEIEKLLWNGPAIVTATQPDQTTIVATFECEQDPNDDDVTCTRID